jgi:non-ribosomal peptide synthase protein (TIGR01720 family)
LLRYLNPVTGPLLRRCHEPQVSFNYLGRYQRPGTGADWATAAGSAILSAGQDSAAPVTHALDVSLWAETGPAGPCLEVRVSWPCAVLADAAGARLADDFQRALRVFADLAADTSGGGLTPSDLSLIQLDQDEIDLIQAGWSDS